MKKIVIHAQKGIKPELKLTAKQAVEEFLGMFPEYKNSFKIEFSDDNFFIEEIIKKSRVSERPNEINATKLTELLNQDVYDNKRFEEIPLCLVNDYIFDKKKDHYDREILTDCLGLTGSVKDTSGDKEFNSVAVSAKACGADKELIKTIFIHELGHVFHATHENRKNVSDFHCENDLCIMGARNYPILSRERLRRKTRGKPPFCDECIASMREYMSHMPELVKEVNAQPREPVVQEQQRIISTVPRMPDVPVETLPVLPHNDRSWKKDLRTFYKQVANDHNYEYKEELTAQNYLVRMKRQDGSVLDVEANNEYNIALGAKDAEGNADIPSVEDMRDLVKYAQSKGSNMNFGKKNEPEFNARLMIACLEAKLKMRHAPKVDDAFLAQINPETKERLQKLLNPEEKEKVCPIPSKTMTIGESR